MLPFARPKAPNGMSLLDIDFMRSMDPEIRKSEEEHRDFLRKTEENADPIEREHFPPLECCPRFIPATRPMVMEPFIPVECRGDFAIVAVIESENSDGYDDGEDEKEKESNKGGNKGNKKENNKDKNKKRWGFKDLCLKFKK